MTPYVMFHYVLPAGAAALGVMGYLIARFVVLPWYGGNASEALASPVEHRKLTPGE